MGVDVISLDCMGGDNAVEAPLRAAEMALRGRDDIRMLLVGHEDRLRPIFDSSVILRTKASLVHAPGVVSESEKPSVAMRQCNGTSMKIALDQVKSGAASCMISAGNTGALMAISILTLRIIDGLERPAIMVIIPSLSGPVILIDGGANVACTANMLAQFSLVGGAWSEYGLGVQNPIVGLLNIGSEETKGDDVMQTTHKILSDAQFINFYGYVEPHDVINGNIDVVVCDGLLGNIMLKSFETMVHACATKIKESFMKNLYTKFIGMLAKPIVKDGLNEYGHDRGHGGIIVGLKGTVIKAHGSANVDGYIGAINSAIRAIKSDVGMGICAKLKKLNEHLASPL